MVRFVRTHELQHVVCEPYHSTVGCASCTPMNYNYEQFMETFYPERVRLVRTNELQLHGTGQVVGLPVVRFVRTNELQHGIWCMLRRIEPGALHAHQRITTTSKALRSSPTGVRFVRANELQQEVHFSHTLTSVGALYAHP